MKPFSRRKFLAGGIVATTSFYLIRPGQAAFAPIIASTATYKKVGALSIQVDVYRPKDKVIRPVVVWIHGGALIMGHRAGISSQVKEHALKSGYALVSIDYRLAPETKLPEIIRDLEDCFTWIRGDGAKQFHLDGNRIAVTGGSAGGYLTLTSGFRVRPRPTVLVSFWGYGDLVGDWMTQPSPHERHRMVTMNREEAFQQVSGPTISDSRERKGDGGAFYQYCRREGIWPQQVSGWDPVNEVEKFYPYMAAKNVTSDYPPTILIHGTRDTDVPYKQSEIMAQQFKAHKVSYELVSIANAEHGLTDGDPQQIVSAYQRAFAFLDKHMHG